MSCGARVDRETRAHQIFLVEWPKIFRGNFYRFFFEKILKKNKEEEKEDVFGRKFPTA
jgi:hypothetical protein